MGVRVAATAFERSLRAVRRALTAYANQEKPIEHYCRAKDAAYRIARFEVSPDAAYDAIEEINRTFDTAIEAARQERQRVRAAEIARLREVAREDDRHGPTSWMRYGT